MKGVVIVFTLLFFCGWPFGVTGQDSELRYFEFAFRNRPDTVRVIAASSDPEVIGRIEKQLRLPKARRHTPINGRIARGRAYNAPGFNWHFVPNDWSIGDFSEAGMDPGPYEIKRESAYWVDAVGRYSPSETYVLGEIMPGVPEEVIAEERIRAFPNPTDNFLNLRFDHLQGKVEQIAVYSADGQQILTRTTVTTPGTVELNLSNLEGGFYTVSVRTEAGRRWAEKVMLR